MKKKGTIIAICLIIVSLAVGVRLIFTTDDGKFNSSEKVNLIIATPAGEAVDIGSRTFKELCEEYSDGTITVDIFGNNLLGDDKVVISGAQVGDIDIAVSSTSPIANMYQDFYLFDAAYLFLNTDEVYDIGFNGETGQAILGGLDKLGLKGLSWWENGFRVLGNNDIPVTTPEQLKGMKLRTMENKLHIKAWQALEANPTPMAFTEVFTALQQGTIDGQENSIGQIVSNKLHEVQKYISLTDHVYTPYCVTMNLKKWNGLTPKQQEIVQRAMDEATEAMLTASQEYEKEAISIMEDDGCEVLDLTDEEKTAFQQKILDAGVYDAVKTEMEHPEYFDQMMDELETYREGNE